jgi:hypothetical protein
MDEFPGPPGQEGRETPTADVPVSPKSQGMRMDSGSRYLILASLIAVVLVLLAGLWNMLRGTSPNLSQTLMRWRVALQFLAIVIMLILVYLFGARSS